MLTIKGVFPSFNIIAIALSLVSTSASSLVEKNISLLDFQRLLRTGLDNELAKIKIAAIGTVPAADEFISDQLENRNIHSKRRSYIRSSRRTVEIDVSPPTQPEMKIESPFSAEHFWSDLVDHAWHTAESMQLDKLGGLTKTNNIEHTSPCPFLVCARDNSNGKGRNAESNSRFQDVMSAFNKSYDETLLIASTHNETCLILTTTAQATRGVVGDYQHEQMLVAMPLLDVMKIHAGTVDEVSSRGWSVPFIEHANEMINEGSQRAENATEAINNWERMIVVDFVPGLGGMKEESELLDVVNAMMGDIQDMGEVGNLKSTEGGDVQEMLENASLAGVPSLSETFSLVASVSKKQGRENGNSRITFWKESLENGLESEHACSEMFATLFVKPRAGYYSFDLVLNPNDGPPPKNYESSASNPSCVTSLIAALSVHPHVLSVKANFPIYHGWHIAQKLDSV